MPPHGWWGRWLMTKDWILISGFGRDNPHPRNPLGQEERDGGQVFRKGKPGPQVEPRAVCAGLTREFDRRLPMSSTSPATTCQPLGVPLLSLTMSTGSLQSSLPVRVFCVVQCTSLAFLKSERGLPGCKMAFLCP